MDAYVVINGKATSTKALEEARIYQNAKRYRATTLVFIDDKLLLVRDNGRDDYSMPGGGFKKNETTIDACLREIKEEIGGLTIQSVKRLRQCDFEGHRAKHKVALIRAIGKPYINSSEINDIILWDMKSDIKAQGHVKHVLKYYLG